MKNRDLPAERGRIVQLFVTLEIAVGLIIARHYLASAPNSSLWTDFMVNVLDNHLFTFALKVNVLRHILRVDNLDASPLEELLELNKIRNKLAHKPVVTKDPVLIDDSEVYFRNPKFPMDSNKFVPVKDVKKQFDSLYPGVLDWLYNLCEKKGVPFSKAPATPSPINSDRFLRSDGSLDSADKNRG